MLQLPHAHMCTARDVRRMSFRTLAIVILNSRRRWSTREDVWKCNHCGGVGSKGNKQWQQMKLQRIGEVAHCLASGGPFRGVRRVMVVPCLRRPASRYRCLASASLFDGTELHGTPARRDIPRRPSNLTFVAVPKLKRNTSRRPPSALILFSRIKSVIEIGSSANSIIIEESVHRTPHSTHIFLGLCQVLVSLRGVPHLVSHLSACSSHAQHNTCVRLKTEPRLKSFYDRRVLRTSQQNILSAHHASPWCSCPVCFLFDSTTVLDTISRDADWNQINPLCTPPRGWTVWSSGNTTSRHRNGKYPKVRVRACTNRTDTTSIERLKQREQQIVGDVAHTKSGLVQWTLSLLEWCETNRQWLGIPLWPIYWRVNEKRVAWFAGVSPNSASTSAVSTCRSISRPGKTASTSRTTWPTLSQLRGLWPSSSTVRSEQQPAFHSNSRHGSNVVEFRFSPHHWGTSARQRLNCRFILQHWGLGARQQIRCKCWRVCVERKERWRFKQCANLVGQAKSPYVLGTESWICRSRGKCSSEETVWSWSWYGNQKMGTEKFRSSSLWNSSRTRISKVTATSSEPMGGSDQFMWRIRIEE